MPLIPDKIITLWKDKELKDSIVRYKVYFDNAGIKTEPTKDVYSVEVVAAAVKELREAMLKELTAFAGKDTYDLAYSTAIRICLHKLDAVLGAEERKWGRSLREQ